MNKVQIIQEQLSDEAVRELVSLVHRAYEALHRPIHLVPPLRGATLELLNAGLLKPASRMSALPYILTIDEFELREALRNKARDSARFAVPNGNPSFYLCSDCGGIAIPGLFFHARGIPLCTACYEDAGREEDAYLREWLKY